MDEQTVTRTGGSDVSRSGWTPAADRADLPRPDAVRSAAAQAVQPLPGWPRPFGTVADADELPGLTPRSREAARDAAFPTSYAQFSINPDTQRLSIKIVDAATNEVIREIPPEQVARIADDLQSLTRHGSMGRRSAGSLGADRSPGGGVDRYV